MTRETSPTVGCTLMPAGSEAVGISAVTSGTLRAKEGPILAGVVGDLLGSVRFEACASALRAA